MRRQVQGRWFAGILLLGLALAFPAYAQFVNGWTKVDEVRSPYQTITIIDGPKGMRQMIFDGKFDGTDPVQSEMDKARPNDLTLSYAKHMMAALPLAAKTERVMIIGLGGACIERYLFKLLPHTVIESAELDPEVVNMARKYFNFHDDGKRQIVHIGDGRKILERSKDKYDLLILDAFSATSIPYSLSTKEFLELCKSRVAEGGLVAANVWYEQADYIDMLKTYNEVFPEWKVLRCAGSTNQIIIALPEKRGLTGEKWMELARAFEKKYPTGLELPRLIDRGMEEVTRVPAEARVMRDGGSPRQP